MTGPVPPAGWVVEDLLASTPVSRSFRVRAGEQRAVWRVDGSGARLLGLDRAALPGVLRAVSAAGLGPACLGADPEAGWLLTGWLPGRAWTAAELREPASLARAAGLLRQVHGLPAAGPRLDLTAAIDRYDGLAGPGAGLLAREARAALALARATGPGSAPCLCHNDPTPGNFIAGPDGRLRLIDWEYAGLGDPAFDLAGLAVGAGLDPAGDDHLLAAYGGHPPGAGERDRHRAWKAFCRVLGDLWGQALQGIP